MNTLYNGDMLQVLKTLDENSIDTCITDPPYHLTSIVKRFGKENSAPAKYGTDGVFSRASQGFLGQIWDGGDIAFQPETWAAVYRVLKPGAYLLAFGGTRTFHRMVCAVEDAGFIPVDTIVWAHGQGFPKALNLSKAIDRHLGAEREVSGEYGSCGYKSSGGSEQMGVESGYKGSAFTGVAKDIPVTPEATLWNGWRSALKPAIELITLAMKPLDGTYAENALKWGVSGFNIEEARIPAEPVPINKLEQWSGFGQKVRPDYEQEENSNGRYPSNLIVDKSEEVRALFPDSKSTGGRIGKKDVSNVNIVPAGNYCAGDPGFGDDGSAARFFYVSKPSKAEKNIGLDDMPNTERINYDGFHSEQGLINNNRNPENRLPMKNGHPTVKAIELMRHLVTLTKTPTGGTVLDPFMGSGTTGCACVLEDRDFIGIEMSEEYFEIAKKRIEYYEKQPRQMKLI